MEATKTLTTAKAANGGSFLIEQRTPEEIFTPEDLSEEQRQIAKTASDFATKEVLPAAAEIEAKKFDVTKRLLRKAGELGLMAVDIPEAYGGLELDKVTS
ncbi:MAG: acyl-CoA dehydrogenase family protein, partial [Acidobacteriia bacterium]|nr:acyl-CoA dehydrogenase family protein [Terriglobia bacterium]